MLRSISLANGTTTPPLVFPYQVVTVSTALTSGSPYATIVNSASATTQTLPASPVSGEVRVVANVGAGTVTVNGTFRSGTSKAISQDNSMTFQYIGTPLAYWIVE